MDENSLSKEIIGAAIEVHKHLGPGLLESAYQACLEQELTLRGIAYEAQKAVPINYKGTKLDCGYRVDLLAGGLVLVELKAVEQILPIHDAQVLTYLKLMGLKLGLILNFNVILLKDGIKRLVLSL